MRTQESVNRQKGYMKASEVNTFVRIVKEHNRNPGVFDYNYP